MWVGHFVRLSRLPTASRQHSRAIAASFPIRECVRIEFPLLYSNRRDAAPVPIQFALARVASGLRSPHSRQLSHSAIERATPLIALSNSPTLLRASSNALCSPGLFLSPATCVRSPIAKSGDQADPT